MISNRKSAVTGSFGYTGKYITRRLLASDLKVITLTGHTDKSHEFGNQVQAFPFNFNEPRKLVESLSGVDTLYNTYWVRFNYGKINYNQAVNNTKVLINSAKQAGVRRLVHLSITNPALDSTLPYFSGKAILEDAIINSGLSYAIVRPTVIFGREDILINNIAFLLSKAPVFIIPGDGEYLVQPIFVEDLAEICTKAGLQNEDMVIDAVGPDIFTFNDLVSLIAMKINSRAWIINMTPKIPLLISKLLGLWFKDVVLTQDEYKGLSSNLLISKQPPLGQTRLAEWLEQTHQLVGKKYASELARHYNPA